MKKVRKLGNAHLTVFSFLLLIMFLPKVNANPDLTLKAGTLGGGIDVTLPLSPYLSSRFNFNYFSYEFTKTRDGAEYLVPITINSAGSLIDIHPFRGVFRFSLGLFFNQNTVKFNTSGEKTITIADVDYQGDFELRGNLRFRKIAPYLGVGWSLSPTSKSRWGFSADIGVLFQGGPRVNATATGEATNTRTGEKIENVLLDSAFLTNINTELQDFQKDIDDFTFSNYFPVLSLGVIFRLN